MSALATAWAQIAPGFTPIVALIAVLVAWRQLALNRANQRETTAKAIFRDYLKLAFDNPDLAAGDYASGPPKKFWTTQLAITSGGAISKGRQINTAPISRMQDSQRSLTVTAIT